MADDAGLRLVGTIRTIELHTLATRFEHVTPRQVAKIQLDIERAIDDAGAELDPVNLAEHRIHQKQVLGGLTREYYIAA